MRRTKTILVIAPFYLFYSNVTAFIPFGHCERRSPTSTSWGIFENDPRFQHSRCHHSTRKISKIVAKEASNDNEDIREYQSQYYPIDGEPEQFEFIEPDDTWPLDAHRMDTEALFENIIPLVVPFLAYMSYDMVAAIFNQMMENIEPKNWVPVDGGQYQAKVIAPVINAIVVPAISILFATLTTTTINTLRLRQIEIRKALNMEGGELRALEIFINAGVPDERCACRCRNYLIQYTSRIISESQPRIRTGNEIVSSQRGVSTELDGLLYSLSEKHDDLPSDLAAEMFMCASRLREQRSNRIAMLQTTYPILHYGILLVLAFGECAGFLIEANQDLLVFLNAAQLKVLWSMLVSTFIACFTVFYDLTSPFSGNYQISASVDQLYTIRQTLKASQLALEKKKTF